ncbi:MAG: hypothetical protein CME62_06105 [Halobacteriovoraceae bacterium]|nr:hypothetical protein [Halobacteriovoraceae bacterium]|tara:strand:+ start:26639 stop:27025 length:387 start_codon:yes stop_codon:yes gene_type:complete
MILKRIKNLALLTTLTLSGLAMASIESDTYRDRDYVRHNNGGCWVTFFDKDNFRGRRATFRGAQDLYDVELDNFVGDDPDSIMIGYNTRVWLYEDKGFDDLKYYFDNGYGARDLDGLDDIESLRIRCY